MTMPTNPPPPTPEKLRKWISLSVTRETESRMDKLRMQKEDELRLTLSWEHFFSVMLPDWEALAKAPVKRPVK